MGSGVSRLYHHGQEAPGTDNDLKVPDPAALATAITIPAPVRPCHQSNRRCGALGMKAPRGHATSWARVQYLNAGGVSDVNFWHRCSSIVCFACPAGCSPRYTYTCRASPPKP